MDEDGRATGKTLGLSLPREREALIAWANERGWPEGQAEALLAAYSAETSRSLRAGIEALA